MWKIEFEKCTLAEDQVTAAEVTIVNMLIEAEGWDAVNPMSSPSALIAWTAVAVAKGTRKDLDEVLPFIQMQPMVKLMQGFTLIEQDDAPAETETVVEAAQVAPEAIVEAPGRVTLGDAATAAQRAAWIGQMG